VDQVQRLMRGGRWLELVFASAALLLASGLQIPPSDGRALYLAIHWFGMSAVALGLVFALRRPSRVTWVVASLLSVYFLANVVVGARVWFVPVNASPISGPPVVFSYIIVGAAVLAQVGVGMRCWQARGMRHNRSALQPIPPVA
jgi:hypothetical protein